MSDRRDQDRRRPGGRRTVDAGGTNLPVPIGLTRTDERVTGASAGAGAFEAQLLGQDGQKRGLRGGKPVLDHAKGAYLDAEYSGRADRRPPRGILTKTEI